MRRLTISVDDKLADMFEALVRGRGYRNRSEAFRDLVRQELGQTRLQTSPANHCVGTLSYVYNHQERQLAARLAALHHKHHDLSVAAMHAHLDHDNCLEAVILRGPVAAVMQLAEAVQAQSGVRHGNFVPIALSPRDKEAPYASLLSPET